VEKERVIIALHDQFSGNRIQDFIAKHDWNAKTEFHVAHVIESAAPPRPGDPLWDQAREKAHVSANALVSDFAETIRGIAPDRFVREHILEGRPADQLVRLARTQIASLIIMGCRGRQGFKRLLLGSVSGTVANKAPCSVVILKISHLAFTRPKRANENAESAMQ
jgi:nucleotide-binding universal stress UspA family protein